MPGPVNFLARLFSSDERTLTPEDHRRFLREYGDIAFESELRRKGGPTIQDIIPELEQKHQYVSDMVRRFKVGGLTTPQGPEGEPYSGTLFANVFNEVPYKPDTVYTSGDPLAQQHEARHLSRTGQEHYKENLAAASMYMWDLYRSENLDEFKMSAHNWNQARGRSMTDYSAALKDLEDVVGMMAMQEKLAGKQEKVGSERAFNFYMRRADQRLRQIKKELKEE